MKKGYKYIVFLVTFIYIFVMLLLMPSLDLTTDNNSVKVENYQRTNIINNVSLETPKIIARVSTVPKVEMVTTYRAELVVQKATQPKKPKPVFNKPASQPKTEVEQQFNLGTIAISNSNFYRSLIMDDGSYYYLNHDLNGKLDNVGMPIIDFRTDFKTKKTIIYAHSAINGGSPFNYLQNYHNNKSFYDEHRYISVTYEDKTYNYEIFSVYVSLADDDWSEGLEYFRNIYYTTEDWGKTLNWYKENSEYDTGVEVSSDDKILILQTCSMDENYRGKYYRANLVVMAKLIEQ